MNVAEEIKQMNINTLRLILGDQLNQQHSWYSEINDDVLYVLMEIKPESEYVTHHIQKVLGIFAAMRNFSDWLKSENHHVRYWKINDEDNLESFKENLYQLKDIYNIKRLEIQAPDEWRLDQLLDEIGEEFNEFNKVSTEHFYTKRNSLKKFFSDRKAVVMEYFYRDLREQENILIENGKPIGGQWNFDKENRNKLPKNHQPPKPILMKHDLSSIQNELVKAGIKTIGRVNAKEFIWPINRTEALEVFDYFLENLLENFGTFQDAMSQEYWSIYHSRISFAMNLKLISPREVVEKTEKYWRDNQDKISIAQCEGFIRQILGWREFMRGIYWWKMPDFSEQNFLNAKRNLPEYFWTGKTKMNCLKQAIKQSLDFGYAHHIQRLMVTGNFALLCGINPDEVDEWYLGIYVDAFEWVEITNTRGMSQFADGGVVATKPYCSSASYIKKMGDYCSNCHYQHQNKLGEKACPFNSLYWNFLDQHQEKLKNNHRMRMMYRVWDKMKNDQVEILKQAQQYLNNIEEL